MARHSGENLVDEKGVAITSVFSFQPAGIGAVCKYSWAEFTNFGQLLGNTPEAGGNIFNATAGSLLGEIQNYSGTSVVGGPIVFSENEMDDVTAAFSTYGQQKK